ncbi:hypothetical protein EDD16DRAFT_1527305 [Pisolithus croceorrhizus]|nr:hypothetical protein EDD16DRAFT_1527305 [Pisolithus croceorrhizus]KAI6112334.1 hypothetical protein EV401DRAFT_1890453 [Pisolithus croceorrhizus]KAI6151400.1 hypothetical protein EDD17DRAFT_1513400 [Pisolithus thermaeus]
MPTFICSCDESSSNKFAYTSHSKKCSSQAIQLPHTSQVTVLERNEEGNFICQCSHKDCPMPFKYAKNLRTHMIKAGFRWVGLEVKRGPSTMEQSNLPTSGADQEAAPSPGGARIDSPPGEVRARPGSSRNQMDLVIMACCNENRQLVKRKDKNRL